MRYSVIMKNGDKYECDDCSLRSFKRFWKCVKREVRNSVVWLDNGELWIYYYGRYKWRWDKVSNNWRSF